MVCKFIEAENFPVMVPKGCEYAQSEADTQTALTTLTVIKADGGMSEFAVGSEKVSALTYNEVCEKTAAMLNERLRREPAEGRTVTLRIDKDVSFAEAQYALAALAQSDTADIHLAVINEPDLKQ